MEYFIITLEIVGQVEQLNLIGCENSEEVFEKLNSQHFRDVEFVSSIMELSQTNRAMLIRGDIQMITKNVEWTIEPFQKDYVVQKEDVKFP